MNTLLISYDLRTPGKDYSNLWNYLKTYPGWARPLESVWLVKTAQSVGEARAAAIMHIDKNDKLIIFDVTGAAVAWEGIDKEVSEWIQTNR